MTRLDAETREHVRREVDRLRRIEIERNRGEQPRWTRATIVESIVAFQARHGRRPTRQDFDRDQRLPSTRTLGRVLGGVGVALDLAFPRVEIEQASLFDEVA